MIDSLPKPSDYSGPEIEFLTREIKLSNEETINKILKSINTPIAKLVNENGIGNFVEEVDKCFKLNNIKVIDSYAFIDKIFFVKDSEELNNIKVAAKYCAYIAHGTLKKIEKAIDDGKKVTNQSISNTIEEYTKKELFSQKFKLASKLNDITPSQLEVPGKFPIIQSGSDFDWNFGLSSTKDNMHISVIACKYVAKYKEYFAKVIRTYMIDSDQTQLNNYKILVESFEYLTKTLLKSGTKISTAITDLKKYIKEKSPELFNSLHDSFGYGIGMEFNNKTLTLSEDNHTVLQNGMVFNVNLTFKNLKSNKGKTYWLQLADTIIIEQDGNKNITEEIKKSTTDIYYNIEEVDEEDESEEKSNHHRDNGMEIDDEILASNDRNAPLTRNYLKAKRNQVNGVNTETNRRKEHQLQLLERKSNELRERLENKDFGGENTKSTKILGDKIRSYDKPQIVPIEYKKGKLYVDLKYDCIIAPMFKTMVPFDGALIKSVTKSKDALYEYLRINFHTPISGTSNISFSELTGVKDPIFIRDLSYKSTDRRHFDTCFKQINDLIKKVKAKEKEDREKSNLVEQETLQLNKTSKRVYIDNISLRPSFNGKSKTVGMLEAHTNGFRFQSNKGERVDFIYKNIKHSFYQPCEKELIVILHFTLKNPILVGKKKRLDIQFMREVGIQADDMRFKSRSDYEEYEQELKDLANKERINKEFLRYTELIEHMCPQIKFDIPYRELAFEGTPYKSSVWLMPTVNALICLVEFPFFVCSLDEIELVYFERVAQSIKNFDIAIVFKDFNRPVHRINSVPLSYLETLKNWLDSVEILFAEGSSPINWAVILAKMKKEPEEFIETGWSFLHHDVEESEDEDSVEDGDPSFEEEEIEDDEESEYDEEEESEDDNSESSFSGGDSELSEEGASWDELERQAVKEERKKESSPVRKPNNKRRR